MATDPTILARGTHAGFVGVSDEVWNVFRIPGASGADINPDLRRLYFGERTACKDAFMLGLKLGITLAADHLEREEERLEQVNRRRRELDEDDDDGFVADDEPF